jgi:hypothetical protein
MYGTPMFPTGSTSQVTMSGDTVMNLLVPALPDQSVISGQITDSSGRGISDVSIAADSQAITGAAQVGFSTRTSTDVNGNYRIRVLKGTDYTLTFTPNTPLP